MNQCQCCGKTLNISVYKKNRKLKSCPKCSANNGKEHVFYEFPKYFGVTSLRASGTNPDGPQSYCTVCRSKSSNYPQSYLCNQVK